MRFRWVSFDDYIRRQSDWHRWFAWHPARLKPMGDKSQYVWLETVERKITNGWYKEYREL
jgi:hypothetical protein